MLTRIKWNLRFFVQWIFVLSLNYEFPNFENMAYARKNYDEIGPLKRAWEINWTLEKNIRSCSKTKLGCHDVTKWMVLTWFLQCDVGWIGGKSNPCDEMGLGSKTSQVALTIYGIFRNGGSVTKPFKLWSSPASADGVRGNTCLSLVYSN